MVSHPNFTNTQHRLWITISEQEAALAEGASWGVWVLGTGSHGLECAYGFRGLCSEMQITGLGLDCCAVPRVLHIHNQKLIV